MWCFKNAVTLAAREECHGIVEPPQGVAVLDKRVNKLEPSKLLVAKMFLGHCCVADGKLACWQDR